MKRRRKLGGFRTMMRELRMVVSRSRQVWRLIPGRPRLALASALVIMSFASLANTAIPLCLGKLVDAVDPGKSPGRPRAALVEVASFYLLLIGAAYLMREAMNVLRRFLVEDACT